MTSAARRMAWVAGAYLAGTVPSAYLLARATGRSRVLAAAAADSSAGDAHLLLAEHAGPVASAVAMAADVAKGAVVVIAARRSGLDPATRAAVGVAVVAGHAFPPYLRAFAGRGLSTAAGVTLVETPVEMVVAGSVLVAGKALGHTGPGSTAGFAAVPVVSSIRRRPRATVAMGAGVLGVILARRLVGIGRVAERDGWVPSIARRAVFDADGTRNARRNR